MSEVFPGDYVQGDPCPLCGQPVITTGAVTHVGTMIVLAFILNPCSHFVRGIWLTRPKR